MGFKIYCCGRRRGLFPGDVLVCSRCDYDSEYATVMPNENKARDVPKWARTWYPGRKV